MQSHKALLVARRAAREFERALEPRRRKQFGQYFSGIRLGKVLAHLAIERETKTVLDPMAGHGDLLDAAWEVAAEGNVHLERTDGVEIDQAAAEICLSRLAAAPSNDGHRPNSEILYGNAFEQKTLSRLPMSSYDLVITNPPYVRYQGRPDGIHGARNTRLGLKEVIRSARMSETQFLWTALADGYSGLADLSVPAWILAGLMVRPGRRLALIVPATWRSRDYGDIIRYLLLRCFELEVVVEDTQPGWFCDALVRTHIIVARRLHERDAVVPLGEREHWRSTKWLEIAPIADNQESLVGAAFGANPEAALASWLKDSPRSPVQGVHLREFDLAQEWMTLQPRIRRRRWYPLTERNCQDLPIFSTNPVSTLSLLPEEFREMLPTDASPTELFTLAESGIRVGQGLRTGCNGFFYVTAQGGLDQDRELVKVSPMLGAQTISVPLRVARPALRNQAELGTLRQGELPPSRLLDLRAWVLPEDSDFVLAAKSAYALRGESVPRVMNPELATLVRNAALTSLDGSGEGKRIPELSAVSTNVRPSRNSRSTPRFWYQLPDFAPRHLPQAFVPRVNQRTPLVECNLHPPLIVDANFATFWAPGEEWSPLAIATLLNTIWCRALMESTGTLLGGGALKLEASHLRQLPLPRLGSEHRAALHIEGKTPSRDSDTHLTRADQIVLKALFPSSVDGQALSTLAADMAARTRALCAARQRNNGRRRIAHARETMSLDF